MPVAAPMALTVELFPTVRPAGGVIDNNELPLDCAAMVTGETENVRVHPLGELGAVEPKVKLRELQPAVSLLKIVAV